LQRKQENPEKIHVVEHPILNGKLGEHSSGLKCVCALQNARIVIIFLELPELKLESDA
jgi:hypothetical protein